MPFSGLGIFYMRQAAKLHIAAMKRLLFPPNSPILKYVH